jgi:hypothetical protein
MHQQSAVPLKTLGGSRDDWAYDLHEALSRHTPGTPEETSGDLWGATARYLTGARYSSALSLRRDIDALLCLPRYFFVVQR